MQRFLLGKSKKAIAEQGGKTQGQREDFDGKLQRQKKKSSFGSGSTVLSTPQQSDKTLLGS